MKKLFLILLFVPLISLGQTNKIKDYKVTILSTMLSDIYIGEWGFAAIIEVDGQRILFDTGSRENTVLQNAKELNIDLNNIKDVFLSHNHKDHTGGLISLREKHPNSFSNAHVGEGIFFSRPRSIARAIFSPVTTPMDPPIKAKFIIATTTFCPPNSP